ncbi:MAG TPA: 3-oxoadipate enol-lactonase [Paracoccaceae bacterium]|nr:3-oxoadipate enol-lactonase [Paracoccaceae bacterium]HMO70296.1 3-oxoadipate enol-lactonase [Paracoccaceae bacterium]
MFVQERPWGVMHVRVDGPAGAPAVVFANSLGTDLRLWDALLPHLPAGLRYIRYDKRGHGLSGLGGPVTDADLAADAIALIERLAGGPVTFVGLSIGGLIGQAVASARPDLVRALVLSNTAARLGSPESWQDRIDAVRAGGLAAIADAVMERWFAAPFRATPELALWRNMLLRTPAEGYIAACGALATADRTAANAALRLPVLAIAGDADGATPPEVVRATAALIPGAAFHVIPGAGHLPCVETPAAHAALIAPFLAEHSYG